MLGKKPLLFFTVIIVGIALFSVTGTWAACPDSVDPDFEWFECNKYRVEFVDKQVGPCTDDSSKQCIFFTTSVLRGSGSKTLSHTSFLQRAYIPIVDITCQSPTCTASKKAVGRGDDATGFGIYQAAVDTWLIMWDGGGPAIGTTAYITVQARGSEWIVGDPLDQLHKTGSKFTDQVFSPIVALEEEPFCPPPPGISSPANCILAFSGTEEANILAFVMSISFETDVNNVPVFDTIQFHPNDDSCGDDTAEDPDSTSYDQDHLYNVGAVGGPDVTYEGSIVTGGSGTLASFSSEQSLLATTCGADCFCYSSSVNPAGYGANKLIQCCPPTYACQ